MFNLNETLQKAKESDIFCRAYSELLIKERTSILEMLENGQITEDEVVAWYKRIGSKTHLEQTVDALFVTQDPESLPALVILRQQNRTNPVK